MNIGGFSILKAPETTPRWTYKDKIKNLWKLREHIMNAVTQITINTLENTGGQSNIVSTSA